MATKPVLKAKSTDGGNAPSAAETPEAETSSVDSVAEAVKRMIRRAKERGYITVDELNKTLPPDVVGSEQIEDIMAQLSEMGINVTEGEEVEESAEGKPAEEGKAEEGFEADEAGRTDDPVRLYLREMGSVELLSREGEIAIAKRIEAGREMMIAGICESPLTIQAILAWNESLKENKLLLRDIIDLEATSGEAEGELPAGGEFTPAVGAPPAAKEAESAEGGEAVEGGEDGSFDDEGNVSLSALEEKLKPQVIETFDKIASTWSKLTKVTAARKSEIESEGKPAKATETKYQRLKGEMIDLVRTVRFSNARIEQLVQQLYTLNRRLMGLEGQLLRMAVDCHIDRDDFLEYYYGHELDPAWLEAPKNPKPKAPPPPAPVATAPVAKPAKAAAQAPAAQPAKPPAAAAAKGNPAAVKATPAKPEKADKAEKKPAPAEKPQLKQIAVKKPALPVKAKAKPPAPVAKKPPPVKQAKKKR